MHKKVSEKTYKVFVPLTSFHFIGYGDFPDKDGPATVINSWNIPDTDIKLVKFSKTVNLSREFEKPDFDVEVYIDDNVFQINTIFPTHNHLSFNSGFVFDFFQEKEDQFMIFPHMFEQKIQNPLLFLRLFCPGNIFALYAFIENKEIVSLHDFHQNINDGFSFLHEHNVTDFLSFYERYSNFAENLRKAAIEHPKSVFESWYKRVNNGIYFFNQTYFTSQRNKVNPDAKDKNNLRLIYLCTALDALIGNGNPSGKDLAEKADLILSNIIGAIKKDIEVFYDERSRYIHANPNTMGGATSNKTIEKFSLYIQKIILVSLELSNHPDFIKVLIESKQKHWFSFYEKTGLYSKYSIKKVTRNVFENLFKCNDRYELADSNFIASKIKIWSQEPF